MTAFPSLRDRVVLVTGGSRGLGREMALALVEAGARVCVTGAQASPALEAVAAEAEGLAGPGRLLAIPADVRDPGACERAVAASLDRFGALHALIANAGLGMRAVSETYNSTPTRFWETSPEAWQEIVDVNLNGAFNAARAVTPHLVAQGFGKIVAISTSAATMVRRGYAPYGPSKAALEAASRIWAQDLAGTGVDVNVYLPGGATDTDLLPPGGVRRGADGGLLPASIMRRGILWLCADESNGRTGERFVARLWDENLPPDRGRGRRALPARAGADDPMRGTGMRLGEAEILRVVDLDPFALPLGFLFPGAAMEAITEDRALLAPHHVDYATGRVLLAVQSHVVRVGGLTILVDTCVGEGKPRPRHAAWDRRAATGYLDRLAGLGLAPEAIDVVLCTHLHADHVGWNTRLNSGRWVPTFPRARYLFGRAELAHWEAARAASPTADAVNHGAFDDSVLPVVEAGRATLVEGGHELGPGLTLLPLPGHSPGHLGLRLDQGPERAVFCGDAIHSPVQVRRPEWSSAFCDDPALARTTRRALLDEAAEAGTVLVPAHLRGATGMRIRRRGGRHEPAFCGCDA